MPNEIIELKYCPRVGHYGNQFESLEYPNKNCKFRKWNKDWKRFECLPQPCTHRYCKANHIDYSLEAKFVCIRNRIPYGTKTEIREFKIKHGMDFTVEFDKALEIAELALKHEYKSSKDVSHIGLNSRLSNAIIQHYNKGYRLIEGEVPLIVYGDIIRINKFKRRMWIASLKLTLCYEGIIDVDFYKIYKIIIDKNWATVLVIVKKNEVL